MLTVESIETILFQSEDGAETLPLGYEAVWREALSFTIAGFVGRPIPLEDRAIEQGRLVKSLQQVVSDPMAATIAGALDGCPEREVCGLAACPVCRGFGDIVTTAWCRLLVEEQSKASSVIWIAAGPDELQHAVVDLDQMKSDFDAILRRAQLSEHPWLGRMNIQANMWDPDTDSTGDIGSIGTVTAGEPGRKLEASLRAAVKEVTSHLVVGKVKPVPQVLKRKSARRVHSNLHDLFNASAREDFLSAELETGRATTDSRRSHLERMADEADVRIALTYGERPYVDLLIGDTKRLFEEMMVDGG